MFQIQTFNAIAPEGMARLTEDQFGINQSDTPDGIILRSKKLHDHEFAKNTLAIARAGAGTNNIPVDRCTEEGIVVFNTPGANANAVKELVLASLLLAVRPVLSGSNWVQTLSGDNVDEQVEANKKQFAGVELEGQKLGVIGLGAIGAMVANDAYRLGMEVTGYDPYVSVDTAWSISRRVKRATDINEIFENCDFITIHVPLNDKTKNMIAKEQIDRMKPNAVILNFARGGLVNSQDVLDALEANELGRYITDFVEPKLLHNKRVLVTPHLGASTAEAEVNSAKMAAQTMKDFLETGEIKNSVNFPTVEMAFSSPYRFTVLHRNVPNMLSQISSEIAAFDINIETMINRSKGDYAYTIVDVSEEDEDKLKDVAQKLESEPNMLRVRLLKNQ